MCLKDECVELEPFNVLVGRNGAGKSAIFKGLVTLSKLMSDSHPVFLRKIGSPEFFLEPGVTLDDLVWMGNTGLPIKFRVWFDESKGDPDYSLELRKGRAGWSVASERIHINGEVLEVDEYSSFEFPTERGGVRRLRAPLQGTLRRMVDTHLQDEKARPAIEPIIQNTKRFRSVWRYRPSAFDVATFSEVGDGKGKGSSTRTVFTNGRGLAPVLQELQGRNRDVFQKIEDRVHSIFSHISRIGFDAGPLGLRLTFMTTRSNALVPAPQEADGVLLATFLCWRLYTAEAPTTICLEEPENGFYPELLDQRYELLREFTEDTAKEPPAAQVLVSTHSKEFLRVLQRHRSDFRMVRAVEFMDGQGTKVENLRTYSNARDLLEHFSEGGPLLPSMWGQKLSAH
jgi:predicted ATPase